MDRTSQKSWRADHSGRFALWKQQVHEGISNSRWSFERQKAKSTTEPTEITERGFRKASL